MSGDKSTTFHEISFASDASGFVAGASGDGQGYIGVDGLFIGLLKAARVVVLDKGAKGKLRHLVISEEVQDDDVPGAKGLMLSNQDYQLDGFFQDPTGKQKPIAVQTLGRLFMQHGMTEKEAQAALATLPGLGKTSDKAREDALCAAIVKLCTGKESVMYIKAVAKADGSKLVSVIDGFKTKAALEMAKRESNGWRNPQDKPALEALKAANAAGANRKAARGGARGAASGTPTTGAPTGAPGPALDLSGLMAGQSSQ